MMIDVYDFLDAFYEMFPIPSEYIGVVYDKDTKEIIAIVNPAFDWQLEEHKTETRNVLLIPRGNFPVVATPFWTIEVIEKAKRIL